MLYPGRPPYKGLRIIKILLHSDMFYDMKFNLAFANDSKFATAYYYTLLKFLFVEKISSIITTPSSLEQNKPSSCRDLSKKYIRTAKNLEAVVILNFDIIKNQLFGV